MKSTLVLLLAMLAAAAPVQSQAGAANAEQGKTLWTQEVVNAKGETRSCTTCHGTDLTQAGQHQRTKKVIEPMAKSVNASRFEDPKKVAKWFKRNCKWTWGRECTEQEKLDILAYLNSL